MRVFVALTLPDAVREGLWRAAAPLRDRGLPVRWVRPDGLHLTLKFLGEVAAEREGDLVAALGRAAGGPPGAPGSRPGSALLTLGLHGFGVFPNVQRPRVVWVGVDPEPALELLQDRIEREFAPLGFPTEARAFRPHLTLGRAGREARPADFAGLGDALARLEFDGSAVIETVDLMESTLRRDGAVYHCRHRERLS